MKHLLFGYRTLVACAFGLPLAASAQTVFDDTFNNGSTVNGATATPTVNSTSYQVASTKNSSSTINPGDLMMTYPSTSSGIAEIQALFTTTPITLVGIGDSLSYSVTFKDTSGLLPAGSSFLSGGLYNSGGNAPVPSGGLAASGIGAGTGFTTGNAQNWLGYIGRINGNGNSSVIATRPAQSGAINNVAQDLIGNNFSATGGYNTPAGTTLHSKTSTVGTLTVGDTFVYNVTYVLSAAGTLTISDSLTDSTLGSSLFTDSSTATGANLVTTTFDGLAFGDRTSVAGAANTMDISEISVIANLGAVPEPSTFALMGVGALAVGLYRRSRK